MAERFLILVHPGSLCGSATFNLGEEEANLARKRTADLLDGHVGPFLVVDGGMEDELEDFRDLDEAIGACLDRCRVAGFRSERVDGPDDAAEGEHFTQTLPLVLQKWAGLIGDGTPVAIGGAWYHPDDGGGCVGAVKRIATECGFVSVDVDPGCATLFDDQEATVSLGA